MKLGRLLGAGALVVGAALLAGCGDDLTSPAAPTPIDTPANEAVVVKTDIAPEPIRPDKTSDDDEITDRQPLLVASNATGLVPVTFRYEFAVYPAAPSGAAALDSGFGTSHDANSTSYRVQTPLTLGTDYTWRVRVAYENEFGAWSRPAPFSLAPVVFGSPPQPVAPARGGSAGTRPVFTVRNGEIHGQVQSVEIQVRLAPEGTELADRHIVGATKTDARAGEEVMISLREDREDLVPGRVYNWQARAVAAHTASRTFHSAWSQSWSFETEEQSLGAPEPTAPSPGAEVGIWPTFRVRNGTIVGEVGPVVIQVQVAVDGNGDGVPDDDFASAMEGRAPMQGSPGDPSTVQLDEALAPMTSYVWRARAVAPRAAPVPVRSPWSAVRAFQTGAGGDYPLGPARNPPPNLRHVIQRVADAHPDVLRAALDGPIVGTPRWPNDPRYEFLGLAVEALREANGGRWGTCFWIHPGFPDNLSRDRVAYYLGNGDPVNSRNFRVIEFLFWADGSIFWWDSTDHLREEYPNAIGYWRHPPGYRQR